MSLTALLVAGGFLAFFGQVAGAVDVDIDAPSSATEGDSIDVTVSIEIPKDERIPIEHVALKVQAADDTELLMDIRWEPDCLGGDDFRFLEGYGSGATAVQCRIFKDEGNYAYTDSGEAFGYGYLKGTSLGYGYNSEAGKGYGYFEDQFEGTRTGAGNDQGYGYGYGVSDANATLHWTVQVDTTGLPTEDVEFVGVVDTNTDALGDFQSAKSEGVVSITAADGGGGGVSDGGADSVTEDGSACTPSCDLGDLADNALVTINFDPDHEVLHKVTFRTTERITNAKVELETVECDSPPSGVAVPPSTFPCRKLQRLDFMDGTADAGDKTKDIEIQWKLRDAWRLGEDPPRAFAFPNGTVNLGHFSGGEWTPTDTDPMDTPADRDATIWDFYVSLPDHLSTFLAGAHDETGPAFSNARPDPATDDKRPTIGVDYTDDGVGVDTDNVTITFDGQDVTNDATVTETGVTYQPPSKLDLGNYDVEVSASDLLGNGATRSWTFEVVPPDQAPPEVTSFQPEDGATVTPDVSIEATYEDRATDPHPPSGIDLDSIVLTVDGADVTADADVSVSGLTYAPEDGFQQGSHDVTLELADRVGNDETTSWSFTVQFEDEGFPWLKVGIVAAILLIIILGAGAYYAGYDWDDVRRRFR